MVAIWTVDANGQIAYTCHRENFPLGDLQPAAEQFSRDQFEEYIKGLARAAVEEAKS